MALASSPQECHRFKNTPSQIQLLDNLSSLYTQLYDARVVADEAKQHRKQQSDMNPRVLAQYSSFIPKELSRFAAQRQQHDLLIRNLIATLAAHIHKTATSAAADSPVMTQPYGPAELITETMLAMTNGCASNTDRSDAVSQWRWLMDGLIDRCVSLRVGGLVLHQQMTLMRKEMVRLGDRLMAEYFAELQTRIARNKAAAATEPQAVTTDPPLTNILPHQE
jgi:hypothetical protein